MYVVYWIIVRLKICHFLQEAIERSSEDRDPGHGFEGNRYILLRITDVMYRCLKEDLI